MEGSLPEQISLPRRPLPPPRIESWVCWWRSWHSSWYHRGGCDLDEMSLWNGRHELLLCSWWRALSFSLQLTSPSGFWYCQDGPKKMLHVAVIAMLAPLDNPYKRSFVKDSNLLIVTNLIHCWSRQYLMLYGVMTWMSTSRFQNGWF